ncbi:MAG: prolyl oligopeptidase family serine peptidase [Burkholderiales bacterium]|nr:prolyl oligopeptidase family serine peptidase [Burkholderiales bacterium]
MIPVKANAARKSTRASKSSGADIAGVAGVLNAAPPTTSSWNGELETTLYKPPGEGPFPILILNHGKAPGNPRAQERARFLAISREFMKRGYAVVIPMRTGFSKSSGDYVEQHCNMTANGQIQARDLQSVLDYVLQQPWADHDRVVLAGQSYGGLTAMAFATQNTPGVRGVLNFAGGLMTKGCQWQESLVKAFGNYGAETAIPSIWFYGQNDSYFGPELAARMHAAYTRAGGDATLVAYGPFKNDAHSMSGSRDGVAIWWPETKKFLQKIGMPTAETFKVAEPYLPSKSDFATVDSIDAVPYLQDKGREQYRVFLTKSMPRAFALSPTGAWSWTEDGDDPAERALTNCQKNSPLPCKLYAVNDYVVWNTNN